MRPNVRLALLFTLILGALGACDEKRRSGGSLPAPAASTTTGAAAATAAPAATNTPPAGPVVKTKAAVLVRRSGRGFLERQGSVYVAHLRGAPYEMGLQYGELLGPEIEGVFAKMVQYAGSQVRQVPTQLVPFLKPLATGLVASLFRPYFKADELDQIRGIVEGMKRRNPATRMSADDFIFINSMVDLGGIFDASSFKCSSIAAWGALTVDGKAFQTRNVDLSVGTGLEEYPLVAVFKPEGGVPFISLGYMGLLGVVSGMNAHGLGLGQVWAFSKDVQFGRPWPMIVRELMGSASGYEEAINAFQNEPRRTYGSNFVFADRGDARGGRPGGCSIEVSARDFASFLDDDPREDAAQYQGQPYAIRIAECVFRGDCCIDPVLRSRQTGAKGPTGDPRQAGSYQNRYEGQAKGLLAFKQQGVLIGPDEMRKISQDVAMRKSSLQCCVYANSDLKVWVSNARDVAGGSVLAYQEPYHEYDFNYYVPTLTVRTATSVVPVGSRLRCALSTSNLGDARELDVHLRIEAAGREWPLAGVIGPWRVAFPARQTFARDIIIDLPGNLPAGPCTLRFDACEQGTRDLVDTTAVEVTVN